MVTASASTALRLSRACRSEIRWCPLKRAWRAPCAVTSAPPMCAPTAGERATASAFAAPNLLRSRLIPDVLGKLDVFELDRIPVDAAFGRCDPVSELAGLGDLNHQRFDVRTVLI